MRVLGTLGIRLLWKQASRGMYKVIERMSKIKNEKKADWAKKNISNVACHLSVSYPSNQLANSGFNVRHCSQFIQLKLFIVKGKYVI